MAAVLAGCTGTPDTAYGTGGISVLQQRGAARVELLTNGKLMVASFNGMRPIEGTNVVRLNTNGSVDSSYGTAGKLNLAGADAALAPDGRLYFISGTPLKLTAYTAAGKPDASFGSVALPFNNPLADEAPEMLVAPNGKIYVSQCVQTTNCGLFRYLPDGHQDQSFMYAGSGDNLLLRAVGADSNVLVSTQSGLRAPTAVTKLTNNGSLDSSFGKNGTLTLPATLVIGSTVIDAAKRVTLTVQALDKPDGVPVAPFVLRFLANGTADTGFGWNGIAALPGPAGSSAGLLTIDARGRTVATSSESFWPAPLRVYRFTTAGMPDKTFGINGMAAVSAIRGLSIVNIELGGLVTDSANRILLGTAVPPVSKDSDGTAAVVRLTS
jgi:uncharacterized delta-60 repeat protein